MWNNIATDGIVIVEPVCIDLNMEYTNDYKHSTYPHVGTNGNDANPGTIDKPFKTIVFAQHYIRQLKNASKFPVGGVVVNIRSGSYDFTSEPLSLTTEDSGKPSSPIVLAANVCIVVKNHVTE